MELLIILTYANIFVYVVKIKNSYGSIHYQKVLEKLLEMFYFFNVKDPHF